VKKMFEERTGVEEMAVFLADDEMEVGTQCACEHSVSWCVLPPF
jgi:hypothetical protein